MTKSEWLARPAPATTAAVPAIAVCPRDHEWPVRAFLRKTAAYLLAPTGSPTTEVVAKVVDLEPCPECGERWGELLDPSGASKVEFFSQQ